MKVRVRRDYYGAEGQTRSGQILDISEARFKQLTEGIHKKYPLVDPVEVGYKMMEAPQNKMMAAPQKNKEVSQAGPVDPTSSPPDGGSTGEGIDASSLVQAQRPTKLTSRSGRGRRRSLS